MYQLFVPATNLSESVEAETAHRYQGILEQLNSDEWRDVKFYADMHTLQCDILGHLPLEMACLVAEYLPLVDIIRLRRVRDLIRFKARGKMLCLLRDWLFKRYRGDGSKSCHPKRCVVLQLEQPWARIPGHEIHIPKPHFMPV